MKISIITLSIIILIPILFIGSCMFFSPMAHRYYADFKTISTGEVVVNITTNGDNRDSKGNFASTLHIDFSSDTRTWDHVKFKDIKVYSIKKKKVFLTKKLLESNIKKVKSNSGEIYYRSGYHRLHLFLPFGNCKVTGKVEVYKSGKLIEKTDFDFLHTTRKFVSSRF